MAFIDQESFFSELNTGVKFLEAKKSFYLNEFKIDLKIF